MAGSWRAYEEEVEGGCSGPLPREQMPLRGLLYLLCQLSGGGKEILTRPLSLCVWEGRGVDGLEFLELKDDLGQGLSCISQTRSALGTPSPHSMAALG